MMMRRWSPRSLAAVQELVGTPIAVADVGARGGIPLYWRDLRGLLSVDQFEPGDDYGVPQPNELKGMSFPFALGAECGSQTLFVTRNPFQSSMYRPDNTVTGQFEEESAETRRAVGEVGVPVRTVDSVVREYSRAYTAMKVDTQGSESQILIGALETLKEIPLVLHLETWLVPPYQNVVTQPVLQQDLARLGYRLFDIDVSAAWRPIQGRDLNAKSRAQIIGLNMMFVPDRKAIVDLLAIDGRRNLAVWLAYWGFFGEAGAIAHDSKDEALLRTLRVIHKVERSLGKRFKVAVLNILGLLPKRTIT